MLCAGRGSVLCLYVSKVNEVFNGIPCRIEAKTIYRFRDQTFEEATIVACFV